MCVSICYSINNIQTYLVKKCALRSNVWRLVVRLHIANSEKKTHTGPIPYNKNYKSEYK